MRCTNTESGCQWTGTVGTLDNHIASCWFSLIPCPNKCEEDKGAGELLLIRKNLDKHLKTQCPKRADEYFYCGEEGTFASIREHDKVCEKKIVACPNKRRGCSLSIEQGKVKEHVSSDCKFAEVACVYESLGCRVRMPRKDIVEHQEKEDKVHIHLMLKNFSLLKEQHETLLKQHDILLEQHDILLEQHDIRLEQHDIRLEQHDIQLEQHDIWSEQQETLSHEEVVVFQLPGYGNKKAKNERFYSKSFYTHSDGYKMSSIILANGYGDGIGTHVSVFTALQDSRFDNQLQWPFMGTVTVELLNQLRDNNHHRMTSVYGANDNMRVGSIKGCKKFLSHSSLGHNPATNTQYLLNDTLYFRVSVKVDSHKPWLVCTQR